ncbi:hypothetical protein [Allofranklinella schreckenbergeri]|uniref:hypothetical protein n=1 Tax=Allofranklinella schreckenbergeri TaxID=1076744 RepID=UPI0011C441FD|nr:hypothetical protein [Allofranklinella schreckenbergeri]
MTAANAAAAQVADGVASRCARVALQLWRSGVCLALFSNSLGNKIALFRQFGCEMVFLLIEMIGVREMARTVHAST